MNIFVIILSYISLCSYTSLCIIVHSLNVVSPIGTIGTFLLKRISFVLPLPLTKAFNCHFSLSKSKLTICCLFVYNFLLLLTYTIFLYLSNIFFQKYRIIFHKVFHILLLSLNMSFKAPKLTFINQTHIL